MCMILYVSICVGVYICIYECVCLCVHVQMFENIQDFITPY